jgi:hypothetical protein
MRPAAKLALLVWGVVGASPVVANSPRLIVIVHPSRAAALTPSDVRAIYLKQRRFWEDGAEIVPINREAGSPPRELFSTKIFGRGSRDLAPFWNQRYFEAGEFPPPTLASDDAVIRFVAGNRNAIGYVLAEEVGTAVHAALTLG